MSQGNLKNISNSALLAASGAFSKLLFLVAFILIYNGLPLEGSGAFELSYALGTTLVLLAELGLRGYAVRELAKVRAMGDEVAAQTLFSNILVLRLGLSAVVFPAALGLVWLAGYEPQVILLTAVLLVFAILDSFSVLFKGVMRAYDRMELDAGCSILGRTLIVCLLAVLFVSGRMDLTSVSASFVAGAGAELLLLTALLPRTTLLRFFSAPVARALGGILTRSLPFAVFVAVGMLYLRTGVFALSKIDELQLLATRLGLDGWPRAMVTPYEAVARFTAAARMPEAVSFLPLAVINALIPWFSRNASNVELLQRTFTPVLRYLGLAGIAIGAVLVAEPELILRLIAKPEFYPAAAALQILGATIPLTFSLYIVANLLICMGEERIVMRRYISALGVNVVLNVILIPLWGVTGAAMALALSEMCAMGMDLLVLSRKRIRIPWEVPAAFVAFAGLLALAALLANPLPVVVRAGVLVGVGAGGLAGIAWAKDRAVVMATWRSVVNRTRRK